MTAKPDLSGEQMDAVSSLLTFRKDVQTLGGYAGTGKTTLISALLGRLPGFGVCAFTGKAANVLRRKGVPAKTIHSTIYHPTEEIDVDGAGNIRKRTVFRLVPRMEFPHRGLIVDEASMVGKTLHDDLRSFGVPIIFVGDHGQLEPVGDASSFNLMAKPDITLETIHRNAGEIARFAEHLRRGRSAREWKTARKAKGGTDGAGVRLLSWDQINEETAGSWDQFICAFNSSRVALNRLFRELLGHDPSRPVPGDRVMCLKNVAKSGLFNGQQGTVGAIDRDELDSFRFHPDGSDAGVWVKFVPDQFGREKAPEFDRRGSGVPFDYAYAVTCHKAQGDEWDRVLVMEKRCRHWDHTRWAYTAASRARVRLDWVCG